jgi:hypothetical protein
VGGFGGGPEVEVGDASVDAGVASVDAVVEDVGGASPDILLISSVRALACAARC